MHTCGKKLFRKEHNSSISTAQQKYQHNNRLTKQTQTEEEQECELAKGKYGVDQNIMNVYWTIVMNSLQSVRVNQKKIKPTNGHIVKY